MHAATDSRSTARGARIGIVVSTYHRDVTDRLLKGARAAFEAAGGVARRLLIVEAPGAFELPFLAQALARRPEINAIVAIGCVIAGETSHDRHICRAVSDALMRLSLDHSKPIGFGLLTCDTLKQAMARSGGAHGNKGQEAMVAVLSSILAVRGLKPPAVRKGAR